MSPATAEPAIQDAFDLALKHHQAGRLREAEQLYRQILARHPAHADAVHYLGVIAQQTGRPDIAVDLIRRAIDVGRNTPNSHYDPGNALMDNECLNDSFIQFCEKIFIIPLSLLAVIASRDEKIT
jgi:protein O-GlcNAc transferase